MLGKGMIDQFSSSLNIVIIELLCQLKLALVVGLSVNGRQRKPSSISASLFCCSTYKVQNNTYALTIWIKIVTSYSLFCNWIGIEVLFILHFF